MRVFIFIVSLTTGFIVNASAQISIPNSTPVTQNFDGIGTTATASLPANWKMSAAGLGGTANWADAANVTATTQAASSGSPTAGGRYNWAPQFTTSDRAIGFMTDGTYTSPNSIMAFYRNTSGATIATISISFTLERYRTNTNTFSLAFFTSSDGVNWTAQTGGDVATNVFATGNSSYQFTFGSTTTTRNVTISNVNIPNNGDLYLRWVFTNTNNTDSQGLGLDNVSVTAAAAPLPNPDLPISCPYDFIFVLDESGSIDGQGGGGAQNIASVLRTAANDLISALNGSGTRVAVVEFGTAARRASVGGSTAYQVVNNTYVTNFATYMGPDGNNTQNNLNYDPEDGSQSTNWEDAFTLVNTVNATDGIADLVIFLTDGRPTACQGCSGTADTTRALNQAIASANLVKTQGSHIFVVAIPNPRVPESNIHQISDTGRYDDLDSNFVTADYSISTSSSIRDDLQRIAQSVCKVDLKIDKTSTQSACAGETIVFTLVLTNNGLDNDTNVVVLDTIPNGFTYVSDDGDASTAVNGNILTWNHATLAGGGGADTLQIIVSVNVSGNHINKAYVSGTQEDIDSTNNQDSFTVAISQSCDDAIACTRDSCGPGGTCINTPYTITASISPVTATICAGGSVALTASGSGGVGTYTFSWSTGATTASINVSPAATASFTVTVTDANRCSATTSRTVSVSEAPNASISPQNAGICNGESITLTASGGTSFSWSTGETTASITVSPVNTTQYSVTVSNAGGCTASAARNVSVNQSPNVTITPNSATICVGNSVTFTATGAGGGGSYSWSTGATTESITVSPLVTTSYIVTVTNAQRCSVRDTVTVSVNPSLAVTISPANVSICAGASATLTASGGTSFSWNTGATTAIITVNPSSTTTYSVTASETSGCSGTASRTVNVNPLPPASISPATVSICPGASATFTASGGTSYSWSTGAITASIIVSPPSSASFSVTVTDANGCTASASRQVTVNQPPTAAISPVTVAICNGASATLTASGGISFSWNTGATTASVTVSPTSNATFTVTVTDVNGCTASTSRQVTINPLPVASIAPSDVAICIGASATLTASGGTSFSWSNGATTASITVNPSLTASFSVTVTDAHGCTASASRQVTVNQLPAASISPATVAICNGASATLTASGGTSFSWSTGATTSSITVSPNSTTTFSVTVTDAAGGCSATASRLVTVNPLPIASISPATVSICNGASATLTASGGTSFSWSTGATTSSITVSPSSTATFNVTVTDVNGCTASTSRQVTVNSLPVASISPSDVAICPGASATLTASGGTAFSWSTGATTSSITVSPASTAVFSVTVTDANGCTASTSRQVTINLLPTASISPATIAICNGASATLTASGGTSFSWNTGATTAGITVSPVATTTFSVTVTDAAGGCSATASRTVTVNLLPTASISPATVAICNGASATLTASGGTSFSWNTGATTASVTVSPSSTTTFSVTVTDANGCTASASRQVTVNPLPVASISPSDVAICAGTSATLTASGGASFSWNTGATTASITVSPSSTTTFSVTVTDANGCTAAASKLVTVNLLPTASISPATVAICNGASATLTASGGTSFSWSTGATTSSITVSPASTTTFSVTVTSGTGCLATASRIVTVNQLPTASISPATVAICLGSSATLTASGGITFSWNTGATTASITKSPLNNTIYTVTVTDGNGCTASASRIVNVNPLPVASIRVVVAEVCSGENATLTASGGTSFSWSTGATASAITVVVSSPTNYIVTVTDANGCTDTASAFIGLINCDDDSLCTNDFCVAGACLHTPVPNCCIDVSDCLGGDACTVEACIGNECYYAAACCDDNDNCTWDYCENGACVSVPKSCEDNDPCTDNSCINGYCDFPPTACDDNNPCTNDDCLIGNCIHSQIICNDGNPCTSDFCDNGCKFVPIPCSDSDPCTTDSCIQGTCISFSIDCNDNDLCTDDDCVNGRCAHIPVEINVIIAKTDVSCGHNSSGTSYLLNFAGLPHGAILNEQFAAQGIHISAQAYPNGNTNTPNVSELVIYDTDIASSNFDLQAGVGNIAIFPANVTDNNNDGNVDSPDDTRWGGRQIFNFDWDRMICSFLVVDIHRTGGLITAYDRFDNVILSIPLPVAPHSFPLPEITTVNLNISGVRKLVIDYKDEGGITDILLDCQSCDGTAGAFVSGGTAPYSYHWSNGETASYVGNICAGRQCVTVTDAHGCTVEQCTDIDVESLNCDDGDPCTADACQGSCIHTPIPGCVPPQCTSQVDISSEFLPALCQSEHITLQANGPPRSTYLWSSGETSMSIQANPGGAYSVTLTDGRGCIASDFYTAPDASSLLSAYVMIARQQVLLQKSTVLSGGVGATNNAGIIKMENGAMITAPGTFARASTISLTGGSAATVQILSPANVTLPVFEYNLSSGGVDVNVLAGTSVTLTGSVYGNIFINDNATVTFTQPAIDVSSLSARKHVTIKFASSCTRLRVSGILNLFEDNIFNPDAMDVIVYVAGNAKVWDRSQVIADIYSLQILEVEEGTPDMPTVMQGFFIANNIIGEEYSQFSMSPVCNCREQVAARMSGGDESAIDFVLQRDEHVSLKAYPNPFSDKLNIEFVLSEDSQAKLEIFNVSGQRMATLFDGQVKASEKRLLQYSPRASAAGMVIYRLKTVNGIYYGKAAMVRSDSGSR